MSTITEITSIPEWEQLLGSVPPTTLVIVSFHAPWAAPCAQMATVLSTLASEYPVTEPPTTKWVSINAEELSDLSETYDVTAVPFLVLLRNGEVVETVSGSSAVKVRTAIETQAKQSGENAAASGPNGVEANDAAVEEEQDPEKKKEELFKRLGDLVKAAPVMLFMKGTPSSPQCGFSRQLVGLLRDNSVKYGFFNILADDEVRQGLKEFADWPTYPQLWIDGELVGGLDIVSCIGREKLNSTHADKLTGQGGDEQRRRVSYKVQRERSCSILKRNICNAMNMMHVLLARVNVVLQSLPNAMRHCIAISRTPPLKQ